MDKETNVVSVYNRIGDEYFRKYFEFTPEDLPHIERFITYLPKGARILDAGCGPGGGVKYLTDQGYIAEGIDLSPKMIEIAHEQVPEGKFQLMDMGKLEYSDNHFDGIMANYSLIHIPTDELPLVIRELKRVLKDNGVLLILSMKGDPDQLVDEPMAPGMQVFVNFFNLKRLTDLLECEQFEIVHGEETKVVDLDGSITEGISIICRK